MTIITPPAASPTQKVKLAMYKPQLTWSVMLVVIMPPGNLIRPSVGPYQENSREHSHPGVKRERAFSG